MLGLLADDSEWRRVLYEAFTSSFVSLSKVLATILAHCSPSYPFRLRKEILEIFIEEIRARHRGAAGIPLRDSHQAFSYVLMNIERELSMVSMAVPPTLQSLGLPQAFSGLPPKQVNKLRSGPTSRRK